MKKVLNNVAKMVNLIKDPFYARMFKKKNKLKPEQRAHKSPTYRNPVLTRGRVLYRIFELKGELPVNYKYNKILGQILLNALKTKNGYRN